MSNDPRELDQDDIQAPAPEPPSAEADDPKPTPEPERKGLYMQRMSGDSVAYGDTVFHYQALEASVYAAISDNAVSPLGIPKHSGLTIELFRYGITSIENLTDETNTKVEPIFENVMICGSFRNVLSLETVNRLPSNVIRDVADQVSRLTVWTEKDTERLGFTRRCSDLESNASGNGSDTQTGDSS